MDSGPRSSTVAPEPEAVQSAAAGRVGAGMVAVRTAGARECNRGTDASIVCTIAVIPSVQSGAVAIPCTSVRIGFVPERAPPPLAT